jgi:hypothetical protein
MQKIIAILLCFFFVGFTFAETCPSVKTIKSDRAKFWKAYDTDNNKPLSKERAARLRNEITSFSMAESSLTSNRNGVHCYYNNNNGSNLEAYYAQEKVLAIKPSKYWYPVTGQMQCAAGPDKCEFQSQQQLATR